MQMVSLQLRQLDVPQGQRLLLHDISWSDVEKSRVDGRNKTMRTFRQWVRGRLLDSDKGTYT